MLVNIRDTRTDCTTVLICRCRRLSHYCSAAQWKQPCRRTAATSSAPPSTQGSDCISRTAGIYRQQPLQKQSPLIVTFHYTFKSIWALISNSFISVKLDNSDTRQHVCTERNLLVDNPVLVPARQLGKCLGAKKIIMQGDIRQFISDFTE